jgi:hypothetical protein
VTGCDQRLRGIRIADGKQVSRSRRAPIPGVPAIVRGAYYGTFENGCWPWAARILWRYKHPEKNFPSTPPRPFPGKVVLGGRDKFPRDRRQDRRACGRSTQARVESSPLIAGGRVSSAATTADSTFWTSDGFEALRVERRRGIFGIYCRIGNSLVIGAQDGRVYGLGSA